MAGMWSREECRREMLMIEMMKQMTVKFGKVIKMREQRNLMCDNGENVLCTKHFLLRKFTQKFSLKEFFVLKFFFLFEVS